MVLADAPAVNGGIDKERMNFVDRYVEMMRRKGRPFELVDGQLFVRRAHWVSPLGPVAQAYRLAPAQCRGLLRNLGGGWIMWTDGFAAPAVGSEWYAVVCRRYTPVEAVASENLRKHIRRGQKRCEVRRVDAQEIARNGHAAYCAALAAYGRSAARPLSAAEFARQVLTDEPFGDIRHHWAAYHEGELVGFIQALAFGKTEINYTHGKWHPEHLRNYPAHALFQAMNEYYLAQQGFQYVNAGFRSIHHPTDIQDFLIHKFGFEQAPTGLHVYFRRPIGTALRALRPFRGAVGRIFPRAKPLFELAQRGHLH